MSGIVFFLAGLLTVPALLVVAWAIGVMDVECKWKGGGK